MCAPLNYVKVQTCSSSCNSSQSANISAALIVGANEAKIFNHLLVDVVLPFLECTLVTETFQKAEDIVCVELVYVTY